MNKEIDHFLRIVDPITDAIDIGLIFHFIHLLPKNLCTNMALKHQKSDIIHAAYKKAINYVINRLELEKRDSKEMIVKHNNATKFGTQGASKKTY
jgi:hypothetical protein